MEKNLEISNSKYFIEIFDAKIEMIWSKIIARNTETVIQIILSVL